MRKTIAAVLVFLCMTATMLAGCGSDSAPTLPAIDLYGSELEATVQFVNGRDCRIVLVEGDSHYDQGDTLQLSFSTLLDGKSLVVGDRVRFSYDYISDVTEYNGMPHITVNEITVVSIK